MLKINDSIKIINIDTNYIKALYNKCNQVYYLPQFYEKKPYMGILINNEGKHYCIPFTSAKPKHSNFTNYCNGRMLIYENVKLSEIIENEIYKNNNDGTYKHILALLVISKMIPIKEGVYKIIDLVVNQKDSNEVKKYKALLGKELSFCVSNKSKIIREASKIYDKQIKTNKVIKNYCDFKLLESVCDSYTIIKNK